MMQPLLNRPTPLLPMLLPFDGAQYANATPRTWALGNAQQLLAHGLPARVPGPPCRSLRTLRHQQIWAPLVAPHSP